MLNFFIYFKSFSLMKVTSLSPIRRGFAPGFVNYKKGCTRLASDKVYQLLAHGWWFPPASSTTKTGHHNNIAEILLKVALNTINQIKLNQTLMRVTYSLWTATDNPNRPILDKQSLVLLWFLFHWIQVWLYITNLTTKNTFLTPYMVTSTPLTP